MYVADEKSYRLRVTLSDPLSDTSPSQDETFLRSSNNSCETEEKPESLPKIPYESQKRSRKTTVTCVEIW